MRLSLDLARSTVTLARRSLIAVRDGQCLRVVCHRGVVWVTQEQDAEDAIVAAGDAFTIRRRGLTLITAMEPSELSFVRGG